MKSSSGGGVDVVAVADSRQSNVFPVAVSNPDPGSLLVGCRRWQSASRRCGRWKRVLMMTRPRVRQGPSPLLRGNRSDLHVHRRYNDSGPNYLFTFRLTFWQVERQSRERSLIYSTGTASSLHLELFHACSVALISQYQTQKRRVPQKPSRHVPPSAKPLSFLCGVSSTTCTVKQRSFCPSLLHTSIVIRSVPSTCSALWTISCKTTALSLEGTDITTHD